MGDRRELEFLKIFHEVFLQISRNFGFTLCDVAKLGYIISRVF